MSGPAITPTRVDAGDARAAMINGNFTLPEQTLKSMKRIREVTAQAADEINKILKSDNHDVGRRIAALDHLQQVKNIACDSLILPHYVPESKSE